METSELRKSNLIIFDTSIVEVSGTLNCTVFVENGGTIDELPAAYCSGIPLTEERLLKLGFEKDKEYFTKRYSRHEDEIISWLMVHYDKSMSRYVATVGNDNNIFAININSYLHIHQLQNLYFALTGEELTLKS